MKSIIKLAAISSIALIAITVSALKSPATKKIKAQPAPVLVENVQPKIQAAILLDVSNSMDGLIEQAKAQLWNMVSTMGKAQCNNKTPQIEIALYEYGRPDNGIKNGFVKQISPFTTDLDELSKQLFSLKTNGGDEFCGRVIFTSLEQLKWDSTSSNYKVIFIAGNEDFLQGDLTYTKACTEAKQKGVIVNTIYCGDKMEGIREHWNLNSECGNGSFTNIDQNASVEEIPTPYDSTLLTLNEQLNDTYIAYGYAGFAAAENQKQMDKANYSVSRSVAVKRAEVKGKKELYKNDSWDIVDASEKDDQFYQKVDRKTLPDSLKNKKPEELKQIIEQKKLRRVAIQDEIGRTAAKRESYLVTEKAKAAGNNNKATLESEVERIIKVQAKKFNMIIK